VVEALSKFLPTRPVIPPAGKSAQGKRAAGSRPAQNRAVLFEKKDTNHDGRLSREEFLANQPDPAAAPARFQKFDADKDSFLSKDEFINMGGKKPSQP
jgi:iduronate 2-sulfatase